MNRRITVFVFGLVGVLAVVVLVYGLPINDIQVDEDSASVIGRPARIYPDYSSTIIPANIASLNFMVQEEGTYYFVRVYCEKGKAIEIYSRSGDIVIPTRRWRKMLKMNRGGELCFDIFVRTETQTWIRYSTITNKIAKEEIDRYLVYRRMHPTHYPIKGRVGIFQRNLENFDEKLLLDNRYYMGGCVNCHTFSHNQRCDMLMGVRVARYGAMTLLIEDGKVSKIETKMGYTTWHPSGKLAVYSINKLPMFYHTVRKEVQDTVDMESALAYYLAETKVVKTTPELSKKERLETWPMWSADGRYLYFCSAERLWMDDKKVPPDNYDKVKYDLVRISYDIDRDDWGEVETVISSGDTGMSIAMPRLSPDGRWLIFCMIDYGFFPPWQQSSDLYIMDLRAAEETGRFEYRRLEINSGESEAWHSWSSNSRWIVFSSKRDYGGFTRSYISYIDENGRAYKPVIVPQKGPEFYASCIEAFNTPEFSTTPVGAAGEKLMRAVRGSADISVDVPITMATPKAGEKQQGGQTWRAVE